MEKRLIEIDKELKEAYKNKDLEKAKTLNKEAKEIRIKLIAIDEKKVADKMLKKEELEDGVWYEGPGDFARDITEAKWNKEEGKFLYERWKFGMKFEDRMDYFGDVIDTCYAGFAPMKKIETL